jgi:hypothetical protein
MRYCDYIGAVLAAMWQAMWQAFQMPICIPDCAASGGVSRRAGRKDPFRRAPLPLPLPLVRALRTTGAEGSAACAPSAARVTRAPSDAELSSKTATGTRGGALNGGALALLRQLVLVLVLVLLLLWAGTSL